MPRNPFYFRELPLTAPFCDRENELKDLISHAANMANVVIYSPRRFGKTSIVKRVQDRLQKEGLITVYMDFFGVDSIEDVAGRMASKLYAYCRSSDSLMKKAMRILGMWRFVMRPDPEYGISFSVEPTVQSKGFDLLEETLSGIGLFMKDVNKTFNIVIDEFQEIAELKESLRIQGIMRSHIQRHNHASYFFVGSRRRLLQSIFNEKTMPFYRSAINFEVNPLPYDDAVKFIVEQFRIGGKRCPEEIARRVVEKVRGYPYYIQRIPYSIFESADNKITENDYSSGFSKAINEEKLVYEATIQVLAPKQIKLLTALAEQPTDKPFASDYISTYNLKSVGSIQGAIKRLENLDYIERVDSLYRVVDPVFSIWLRHLKG